MRGIWEQEDAADWTVLLNGHDGKYGCVYADEEQGEAEVLMRGHDGHLILNPWVRISVGPYAECWGEWASYTFHGRVELRRKEEA